MSDLLAQKLQMITALSAERIAEDDLAERLAWCASHGEDKAHVFIDDDGATVWWGGTPLATIDATALSDDVPLAELRTMFIPDAPDSPPDLA